jgi:hypothetical protein
LDRQNQGNQEALRRALEAYATSPVRHDSDSELAAAMEELREVGWEGFLEAHKDLACRAIRAYMIELRSEKKALSRVMESKMKMESLERQIIFLRELCNDP